MKVKVAQSYPTLCQPLDCIVHGILQTRILEWVAVPFSRDGGISGLFSSGGPSVRFLTRYDGEVSEPFVGQQGKLGLHASGEGEHVTAPEPW